MTQPYLILDCNYLSHRAKYVFGGLRDAGEATGVIYGFLRDLLTLQERFNTNRFVFCWDSPISKRKEVLSTYKQHRVKEWTEEEQEFDRMFRKQIAKLKHKYLHTIGYRNIFWQDGYEADDIIAAVRQSLVPGLDEGIIVTADQDLYQCLKPNISLYNPKTKKLMTFKGFHKKYGIYPKYWTKVKAIAGCSSDNIKGVYGIGEKTAIKYITGQLKIGSKQHTAIKGHWKDVVLFNRQLVELPLKGVKPIRLVRDEVTQEGWNKVCKKLGMKSIRYKNVV